MPILSGNLFKPYTAPVVKVNVMSISSACIMEPTEFATSNYTISVEISVFLAYTGRTQNLYLPMCIISVLSSVIYRTLHSSVENSVK